MRGSQGRLSGFTDKELAPGSQAAPRHLVLLCVCSYPTTALKPWRACRARGSDPGTSVCFRSSTGSLAQIPGSCEPLHDAVLLHEAAPSRLLTLLGGATCPVQSTSRPVPGPSFLYSFPFLHSSCQILASRVMRFSSISHLLPAPR